MPLNLPLEANRLELISETDETLDGITLCETQSNPPLDGASPSNEIEDQDAKKTDLDSSSTLPSRCTPRLYVSQHDNLLRFQYFLTCTIELGIATSSMTKSEIRGSERGRNACKKFFENLGTALKLMDRNQYKASEPFLNSAFACIRDMVIEADSLILANIINSSALLYGRGRSEIWGLLTKQTAEMAKISYGESHPIPQIFAQINGIGLRVSNNNVNTVWQSVDFHIDDTIVALHWRNVPEPTDSFFHQQTESYSTASKASEMSPHSIPRSCVRALFNHSSDSYHHLSFQEGDVVQVLHQRSDGWWFGARQDVIGWFPSTLTTLLRDSPSDQNAIIDMAEIRQGGPSCVNFFHQNQNDAPQLAFAMPSVQSEEAAEVSPIPLDNSEESPLHSVHSVLSSYRVKKRDAELSIPQETRNCEYSSPVDTHTFGTPTTPSLSSTTCPTLTSNSADSSESTRSNASDVFGGFTEEYCLRLTTLAKALVEFWSRHLRFEVHQFEADYFRSCAPGTSEPDREQPSAIVEHGPSQPRLSRVSKRKKCQLGQGEDEDEDEFNRERKRTRTNPPSLNNEIPLLACPFYKHDPPRYSEVNINEKDYRGCSSVYLTDISRLK